MFTWLLRKLFAVREDTLEKWIAADTSIGYYEKAHFVNQLSYVGGIVGMHHPRWKEFQADYLGWKRKLEEKQADGTS